MTRTNLMLGFAAMAYLLALGNIIYIIGFLADFGVPKGISDGAPIDIGAAVAVDTGLILLFGLHHSLTARASFKRWWTRIVPAPVERATYLCMTAIATALVFALWQPVTVTVWQVQSSWFVILIHGLYLATWAMMMAATFHFGHFSFFGLAQAWQNFRRSPPREAKMTARCLYALVRHPISVGWMITPLLQPHLTVGHLIFAFATIAYILMATPFEEADLIADLGDDYRDYRKQVPAFVPRVRMRATSSEPAVRQRYP